MNFCPPKPGLTLIINSRSMSSIRFFQHGDRCLRAHGDARLSADRSDMREQPLRMRRRFEMKRDDVRTGRAKRFDVSLRFTIIR